MSNDNLWFEEALTAQSLLQKAAIDQYAEIGRYIQGNPGSPNEIDLIDMQTLLLEYAMSLQTTSIKILGANTVNDLSTISETSERIKLFTYNTRKVEKTIKIITAAVIFIGAAITGKPLPVIDAAIALNEAMNKSIEEESDKGDEAAVVMAAPFSMEKLKSRTLKKPVKVKSPIKSKAVGASKKTAVKSSAKSG